MTDGNIEQTKRDFAAENASHLARASQLFATFLPFGFASLFPVDLFLTHLIVPPRTLMMARACMVLYHAVLAVAAYTPAVKRRADAFAVLWFISTVANVVILTVLTGGSVSPYNEPLIGVIFFVGTFAPWRMPYFVPAVLACALMYPSALVGSGTLGEPDMWVPQVACEVIACGLAVMASSFLGKLRWTGFINRLQLDKKSHDLELALATIQEQQRNVNVDLNQARIFQQKLVRPLPVSDGIEFAALYTPAEFLGGDFYNVTCLGPDWYRLFIADVTGHGAQAAMRTIILHQQLQQASRTCETPWALLATMNDAVIEAFGSMMVNYCALCIDFKKNPQGWLMTGTNAGLPEPALSHQHDLTALTGGGAYQGIVTDVEYPRFERQLSPGDGLVVATDGVVDLLDTKVSSVWVPDQAHFTAELQRSAGRALDSIKSRIPKTVEFSETSDDLTMLVVRVPPSP